MKIKQYLLLLLFLVGTAFGQGIERSNWNSAKIDAWSPPNGGAILNGVDQWYQLDETSDIINMVNDQLTINTYFKFTADASNNQYIYAHGWSDKIDLRIDIANMLSFGLYTSAYQRDDVSTLVDGETYNIQFVYDGVNKYVYIDKTLILTVTQTGNIRDYSTANARVGSGENGTKFFNGAIYFISFDNHALPQSEVTQAWNNGQPHLATVDYKYQGASQDELVTNGDFATDTDWTKQLSWTIGSGVATCDGTQVTSESIYQNMGLELGKKYRIDFDVTAYTAGQFRVIITSNATSFITPSVQSYSYELIADGQTVYFQGDSDFNGSIDNVSITQIGEVLNIPYDRFGTNGAIDISGNELHTNSSGSPIAPLGEHDFRGAIGADYVMTNTAKLGHILKYVIITNNTATSQDIDLGTSAGAVDVINNVTIAGNSFETVTVGDYFNALTTLYVDDGTSGWVSNVDMKFFYEAQ